MHTRAAMREEDNRSPQRFEFGPEWRTARGFRPLLALPEHHIHFSHYDFRIVICCDFATLSLCNDGY